MGVFKDISLEWRGEPFVIPAKRVMRAIAIVEREMTLSDLVEQRNTGRIRLTQVAAAFGHLLRFAGAKVEDEEVYEGMFGAGEQRASVLDALDTLLTLVIPPSAVKHAEAGETAEDPPSGNSEASAPAS